MGQHDFLTLDDIDTANKRVFLRVDINVPLDPSTHLILDDTRIRAISETLSKLENAKVVLGSHQSRPGKDDFTSMEPHAEALASFCNQDVKFVEDVMGPHARQRIAKVEPGQVLVLDNLRFCAEENVDDKPEKLLKTHFVKTLAPLFDLNVNDAFATAHRSQPSIVGLAEALPSAAGRLMQKEMAAVSKLLVEQKRPCVYILGGAKVEDKVPVIKHILDGGKADKILLGGVPAKLFLRAKDKKISTDDERDIAVLGGHLETAKGLLAKYNERIELWWISHTRIRTERGSITTSIRSKLRDQPWTLESRRSTSTPKRLKAQPQLSPMDPLESSRETGLTREQDGS